VHHWLGAENVSSPRQRFLVYLESRRTSDRGEYLQGLG